MFDGDDQILRIPDAFCLTTYRWSTLARVFDYTDPVFYSTTDAYVRGDDTRFDKDLAAINNNQITVAVIDGEGGENIRHEDFSASKSYSTTPHPFQSPIYCGP